MRELALLIQQLLITFRFNIPSIPSKSLPLLMSRPKYLHTSFRGWIRDDTNVTLMDSLLRACLMRLIWTWRHLLDPCKNSIKVVRWKASKWPIFTLMKCKRWYVSLLKSSDCELLVLRLDYFKIVHLSYQAVDDSNYWLCTHLIPITSENNE